MPWPNKLVGRESELARLREALPHGPLVTVWGPPGVGKSRLVREALAEEAVFCPLGAVREVEAVLQAVALALQVAPTGVPTKTTVARALGRARRPLVLDGADGAKGALETLLPRWLDESETVRLVVTAQSPLGLEAEVPIELEPLGPEDALAVWLDATGRLGHHSDPALARQIVDRLEGLPLALEWYASRASLLGEAACLEQLQRVEDGQGPLSAALSESLRVLADDDRRVLSFVAMFEQGAPAAIIESALGAELAVVERLARRALVRTTRVGGAAVRVTAYRAVLKQVRHEALAEGRWEELARIHAHAVLGRIEAAQAETMVDGMTVTPARQLLAAERRELEAIITRFEQADPELAVRAAIGCAPLALHDGTASAAAATLTELVARLPAPLPAASLALGRLERRLGRYERAREQLEAARDAGERFDALIELAHLDRMQSRSDAALEGYQQALALAERQGDSALQSIGMGELGRMLQSLGRFREAQAHHERAIALDRTLGLPHREALERSLHARATHRAGQVREALALHEHALELHEQLDQPRLAAAELGHLGFCHHELGQVDRAEPSFRRSIDGLADAGDVVLECIERTLLARLLCDAGRLAEAKLELAIVEAATAEVDMPRVELTRRFVAGLVELGQDALEPARRQWDEALALGLHLEVGFEALLPAHLALVEARLGHSAVARQLLEQSRAVVARLEAPGLLAAFEVLAAAARGDSPPEVSEVVLSSSSDARRVLRLVQGAGAKTALRIARDGRRLVLPDGGAVDVSRRTAPRRLMLALAQARLERPGTVLEHDELIAAGWPGERMGVEAARKRLRTAIWTLRKLGLEAVLLTRDEGYLLDAFVEVEWLEPVG